MGVVAFVLMTWVSRRESFMTPLHTSIAGGDEIPPRLF